MDKAGHIVVNTSPESAPHIGRVLAKAGLTFEVYHGSDLDAVADRCAEADGIIVHAAGTLVRRSFIEKLRCCRVIVRLGVGVDNVDVEAATERGIAVANVPDYCEEEVASHAAALSLALIRQIPAYDRAVRSGRWRHDVAARVPRLSEIAVGTVGFGRIGRAYLARMKPFAGRLLAADPYVPPERVKAFGVEHVTLEELFASADLVSIHLPLTNETRGLVGERLIGLMKPTAYLVNTARGSIVDETALREALEKRRIAGAALDVFEREPLPGDHPFLGLDNVILTPHVAWYSEASRIELLEKGAEEAVRAVLEGAPRKEAFVNPEAAEIAALRRRPSEAG